MKTQRIYDGLLYACAKGRQKEWARKALIIDMLYDTKEETFTFLKIQDMSKLGKCDEENEQYYIYKFGYQYRIPKTEIDLYVSKKDNRLFIKKEGIGLGWEHVEKAIYDFLKEQIRKKNLHIRTNFNAEEYLIK